MIKSPVTIKSLAEAKANNLMSEGCTLLSVREALVSSSDTSRVPSMERFFPVITFRFERYFVFG